MIYGSNTLPIRQLANPPITKSGDHAPTQATFTTTRKTAQPTIFVPLEPCVVLVDTTHPSIQLLRGPITLAMLAGKPSVTTLNAPPLRFSYRDFNTSCSNLAIARKGSSTPTPAYQQKPVIPIRPLQLEHELVKRPDKGTIGLSLLLTLSAHAPEDYTSCSVCVCVCVCPQP